MAPEYWILIIVAAALAAGILGFFGGRASAPGERRIREMARERDEARSEAEQVRGEVARHFDESARMFGRLAQDYRAFFEHFAETAQNLGMSEGRARELLHRADPRIVDATGEAPTGAEDVEGEPGSASGPASEASVAPDVEPGTTTETEEHVSGRPRQGEASEAAPVASEQDGPAGEGADDSADAGETAGSGTGESGEQTAGDEPKSEVERQRESRGESH